jgi:hypothetical protein
MGDEGLRSVSVSLSPADQIGMLGEIITESWATSPGIRRAISDLLPSLGVE